MAELITIDALPSQMELVDYGRWRGTGVGKQTTTALLEGSTAFHFHWRRRMTAWPSGS